MIWLIVVFLSANLSWYDNDSNEDGYVIERTVDASCLTGWEIIGYEGINAVSFYDPMTIPGACYRIAAYNQYGLSGYSNIAQLPLSIKPGKGQGGKPK